MIFMEGSYRLFTKIFEGLGPKISFYWYAGYCLHIEEYINKNTKASLAGDAYQPMMNIIDIEAAVQNCQRT
jgi:cysteine-S-conjugate beta-lyase